MHRREQNQVFLWLKADDYLVKTLNKKAITSMQEKLSRIEIPYEEPARRENDGHWFWRADGVFYRC